MLWPDELGVEDTLEKARCLNTLERHADLAVVATLGQTVSSGKQKRALIYIYICILCCMHIYTDR